MTEVKSRNADANFPTPPGVQVVHHHQALDGYLDDLLEKATDPSPEVERGGEPRRDTIESLFDAALSEPEAPTREASLESRFASPTQCLRFGIDGLAYALPLIEIYRVVKHTQAIAKVPGLPAWCLGAVVVKDKKVRVINFQTLAGKRQNLDYNYQYKIDPHLLLLGRGDLAFLIDDLGAVEKLSAEDIQWYAEDRADFWQAGVIKQSLSTLLELRGVERVLKLRR